MLPDVLLTEEEKAVKHEAREFVKNEVSPELTKKLDRDEIRYPREFVKTLGNKNLLGLRFPRELGGRGLNWTGEIAALEEIGVLGTALGCAFAMPSIVGEALYIFGTEEQKKNFLVPMLKGDIISGGGTDRAERRLGLFRCYYARRIQERTFHRPGTEAVCRGGGGGRLLYRLLQHQSFRRT